MIGDAREEKSLYAHSGAARRGAPIFGSSDATPRLSTSDHGSSMARATSHHRLGLRLVRPSEPETPVDAAAPQHAAATTPQYAPRIPLARYAAPVGAGADALLSGAVWWDPRCGALLGATSAGVRTYADLLALVHPDDRAAFTASWQPYLDPAREGECYEHVFRTAIGGETVDDWTRPERHVAIRGRVLFEVVGGFPRATRLLGTIRDVSAERERDAERERLLAAERAARHEAERVRSALEAAGRVTEAARRPAPVGDVVREVLEHVRVALRADTATVLLADADGTTLAVEYSLGLEAELAAQVRVPVGRGVAGRIAAERRPLRIDDLSAVEIVGPHLRHEVRSFLGVPLVVGARLVGVLDVGRRAPHPFTDDDGALLAFVAERVAAVVLRAQHDETAACAHREAEAARERAEAANTVKSQFLMAVSHQFRTALDAVGGHAQLVALGVHGPVTPAQADALTRIQRNQRRLLDLVTAVLHHIRLDLPALRGTSGERRAPERPAAASPLA